jgi:hypothetical protein
MKCHHKKIKTSQIPSDKQNLRWAMLLNQTVFLRMCSIRAHHEIFDKIDSLPYLLTLLFLQR